MKIRNPRIPLVPVQITLSLRNMANLNEQIAEWQAGKRDHVVLSNILPGGFVCEVQVEADEVHYADNERGPLVEPHQA